MEILIEDLSQHLTSTRQALSAGEREWAEKERALLKDKTELSYKLSSMERAAADMAADLGRLEEDRERQLEEHASVLAQRNLLVSDLEAQVQQQHDELVSVTEAVACDRWEKERERKAGRARGRDDEGEAMRSRAAEVEELRREMEEAARAQARVEGGVRSRSQPWRGQLHGGWLWARPCRPPLSSLRAPISKPPEPRSAMRLPPSLRRAPQSDGASPCACPPSASPARCRGTSG